MKVGWTEDLEDLAPGPELARRLDEVTVSDLTASERVRMMRAHQKLVSYFQARLYQDMAAVWEFEQSLELEDDFAAATQEIRAAHLVVEQTSLDAPYLTTGQLRALLHRFCITVDPEHATRTYEEAVTRRRVVAEPNSDGTAILSGFDPPDRVEAATNSPPAGVGRERNGRTPCRPGHPRRAERRARRAQRLRASNRRHLPPGREHPDESPWRYVVTDQETGAVVKEAP